jgi:hypothetical protein
LFFPTDKQVECFTRTLNCKAEDLTYCSSSTEEFDEILSGLKKLAVVTLVSGDKVSFLSNLDKKRFILLKGKDQNYLISAS